MSRSNGFPLNVRTGADDSEHHGKLNGNDDLDDLIGAKAHDVNFGLSHSRALNGEKTGGSKGVDATPKAKENWSRKIRSEALARDLQTNRKTRKIRAITPAPESGYEA